MKEIWKTIQINENYAVSNLGHIKRLVGGRGTRANRILKPSLTDDKYLCVHIHQKGRGQKRTIHTLVAAAFIGPKPLGLETNHKDGNKKNNQVANLEYCTHLNNMRHAYKHGLIPTGENNGRATLRELDVIKIRQLAKNGIPRHKIMRMFSVSDGCIRGIVDRRNWAWL